MMQKFRKVVVVSQHYPPDHNTTAAIVAAIANHLALKIPVLVLSGTSGSISARLATSDQPTVVEVKNWMPEKGALVKRAAAEVLFTARIFFRLLMKLQRGDVALTVTAPFVLPYAVAAAAKLKRARSVLIMHDLYPHVLVIAGIVRSASITANAIRSANALMFRALSAVVIIGRDTEQILLHSRGMTRDKIWLIPNWATLTPGIRPIRLGNPYRCPPAVRFVVGLSGNLGFTHDPVIVFDAARMLRGDLDIHFLLSGWGIGFERLKDMQREARLPNVTLIDRVEDENLEQFLSAADAWLIPYRKDVAGVSVPSRFYNLLAIGRPVILVSEPHAEAALTVAEHGVGWVVTPGNADELARKIRVASFSEDPSRAKRAVAIAERFNLAAAMTSYSELIESLLRESS